MRKPNREAIQAAAVPLLKAMETFSNTITGEIPNDAIGPVFALTKRLASAATGIQNTLKPRIQKLVAETGQVVTAAGSRVLDLSGWRMEIRPNGGGYDEARAKAKLQGAGLELADFCEQEVVWHLDLGKVKRLVKKGRIPKGILKDCKKQRGWSVMSPVETPEDEKDG